MIVKTELMFNLVLSAQLNQAYQIFTGYFRGVDPLF